VGDVRGTACQAAPARIHVDAGAHTLLHTLTHTHIHTHTCRRTGSVNTAGVWPPGRASAPHPSALQGAPGSSSASPPSGSHPSAQGLGPAPWLQHPADAPSAFGSPVTQQQGGGAAGAATHAADTTVSTAAGTAAGAAAAVHGGAAPRVEQERTSFERLSMPTSAPRGHRGKGAEGGSLRLGADQSASSSLASRLSTTAAGTAVGGGSSSGMVLGVGEAGGGEGASGGGGEGGREREQGIAGGRTSFQSLSMRR